MAQQLTHKHLYPDRGISLLPFLHRLRTWPIIQYLSIVTLNFINLCKKTLILNPCTFKLYAMPKVAECGIRHGVMQN
jgi:hypothetical protein